MESFAPRKFEKYLLHVNESVDRLTTNRTFQRIFEEIEKRQNISNLSLPSATDTIYGTAKFSSASSYVFDEETLTPETTASYYNDILGIDLLEEYADSMSDKLSSSVYWAPSSGDHQSVNDNSYWIKTDYGTVDFSYFPNGINCITGTLELGVNNLYVTFGKNNDVLSGDVMAPYTVDGYTTYVNISSGDVNNINNYISYNDFPSVTSVSNLLEMDGMKVKMPFSEECKATVKQNICNWTTYSSYKQSFVELHYTTKIDVNGLYSDKYGTDSFKTYSSNGIHDEKNMSTGTLLHPKIVFKQKPIVMMQVGFYGGDAENVSPTFGFDNRTSGTKSVTSEFYEYDTISETPLTVNSDNPSISPVNGFVMLKKFENEYDDDGIVTNNIINFDVVMKFMVGSEADPKLIYGLTSMNSRAKVQFAIIGV